MIKIQAENMQEKQKLPPSGKNAEAERKKREENGPHKNMERILHRYEAFINRLDDPTRADLTAAKSRTLSAAQASTNLFTYNERIKERHMADHDNYMKGRDYALSTVGEYNYKGHFVGKKDNRQNRNN
jgi:hypothetical protein